MGSMSGYDGPESYEPGIPIGGTAMAYDMNEMHERGMINGQGHAIPASDSCNHCLRLDNGSATWTPCTDHAVRVVSMTNAVPASDMAAVDELFDVAGPDDGAQAPVKGDDPKRPEAKRGRYYLPNHATGKTKGWQRVTNFTKLTDDTYHLELWKQRNVTKGLAVMLGAPTEHGFRTGVMETIDHIAGLDVKADKERLGNITAKAQEVAGSKKMADEGTALHKSSELVDYAGGDLNRAPERHRRHMRLYLDALAVHGLTVLPDMIERVVASSKYEVAGKLDRICGLRDGSNVVVDLKTGDSIDLSFPSIAAQLDAYRDGINAGGIFDGRRYDQSIKVRDDFAIVVHLPSTRHEVTVYAVNLAKGAIINAANLAVREARRIKASDVATVFDLKAFDVNPMTRAEQDQHWLEQMNAAFRREQLIDIAARARAFGQWNERLAGQARLLATEMVTAS